MTEVFKFSEMSDKEVSAILKKYSIGLTVDEARRLESDVLKRPPTVTEAIAWGIEGSEHCSYRSSKKYLKLLPNDAPNVILGPSEDAGIVSIAQVNGERYGIVLAHESHNHPSQIVPFEGAATGVGGIVRDVICMGARVIAIADPLRFGDVRDIKSKWIFDGVTAGIGGYGNPIGVPTLAGDIYFNSSFNQNCLVNVVAVGVVRESDIIHSHVPHEAGDAEYDFVLVGKPTDNSGMGGASFASSTLHEDEREENKSAVQEPNAFLKRHLMLSTYDLFRILRERGLLSKVAFKDLGAGGILCASSEMVAREDLGAMIDLDTVVTSMDGLSAAVKMCSETQERFLWATHPEVTPIIIEHYNKTWALPSASAGAQAKVIGHVRRGTYRAGTSGVIDIDAHSRDITAGLKYDRPLDPQLTSQEEPGIGLPAELGVTILEILGHQNVSSRHIAYNQYDKQVQCQIVIEAGMADAGVLKPLFYEDIPEEDKKVGIALSVDGNPRYGRIHPYWQGVNAVVESMRNVAAVGAMPWALTDCLNYGSPEDPHDMWEFVEGVRGVAEAARYVYLKGYEDSPVPIVSGNVSFYNEHREGNGARGSIDPCAIVSCLGRLEDAERAITFQFKKSGSDVLLIGNRLDELGGSVYYDLFGEVGANVPRPDFDTVKREIYAVTDAIEKRLVLACHDISDGGFAAALAEMCFGGRGDGRIGVEVDVSAFELDLRIDRVLFSETGGFIMEVAHESMPAVVDILDMRGVWWTWLGKTTETPEYVVRYGNSEIRLNVEEMAEVWRDGLGDKIRS